MATQDKKTDVYINKSAAFAKPIMNHLRELVHKACPEVEETLKWSFPHFIYKGSILCSMAAFKQHCAFGFWLSSLMKDPKGLLLKGEDKTAMGNLGQLKKPGDLPSDKVITQFIKEAMHLIDKGIKLPKKENTVTNKELEIPDYILSAIKKNKNALTTFNQFNYTNKKEYLMWIKEAKTDETREKRLKTAVEWMSEGKIRNWKYLKC